MTTPFHPSSLIPHPSKGLWVITSYFNPCGYETRRRNYVLFREGMRRAGVPLLTVECAFGRAPFVLGRSARVVRVRSACVMWQKERLLNIALARLPRECVKVAWLDCDVLFENDSWAVDAARALEEFPVVQLFERAVRLPPGETHYAGDGQLYAGVASVHARNPSLLRGTDFEEHGHTGFAWAAQRELLEQHGFYDACVAGSGDHMMAHALCGGGARDVCVRRTLGRRHLRHFSEWAGHVRHSVRARVGYVPGTLLHLWHGDKRNRRYLGRNRRLASFRFDPLTDLRLSPAGCWEWASDKPDMHRWFVEYFNGREEDGARENANGSSAAMQHSKAADNALMSCAASDEDEGNDS